MATPSNAKKKFVIQIIKPSHYDDDGYVIQWLRAFIPSNSLACLYALVQDATQREAWLHEIKHDGFRVIARKDGDRVRLCSRPGNDLTDRFPLIVETLANLRARSCIIDGEAVACDDNGLAVFDRIRYRRHDGKVFLYAFDLRAGW